MKTKHFSASLATKGIAPLIIVVIIAMLGGGTLAVINRSVLKTYFEKGDKPTGAQFGTVVDSKFENGDIPTGEDFAKGDKPSASQFETTIDSELKVTDDKKMLGLKEYNPTKEYLVGDTVVYNTMVSTGASNSSDTSASHSGETPTTITSGVPENWPKDVPPVYPGAQIISFETKSAATGEEAPTVRFSAPMTSRDLIGYYTAGLKANEWVIGAPSEGSGMSTIAATKDSRTVLIEISGKDGAVTVSVSVAFK